MANDERADFTVAPDGYETVRRAGIGTFSEIWQVRDRSNGRMYALKQLRPEWREDETANALLRTEAQIGPAVRSRHVVRVLHSGSDGTRFYSLLEWIEGRSLESILNERDRLPIGTAIWIARQVAEGLSDLAAAGFAHGDVKPANVLVDVTGEVKLIDLGFAQPLDPELRAERPRWLAGTPEYMAPEALARDRAQLIPQDIYALGVTLFLMLSGRLPFTGMRAADTLRLQRQAKPPDIQRLRPDIPTTLAEFVERLLAKHPLRRPTNYSTLLRELFNVELDLLPSRYVEEATGHRLQTTG